MTIWNTPETHPPIDHRVWVFMEDGSYSIGEVTKNHNWIFQSCTGINPVSWTELPVRQGHDIDNAADPLNTILSLTGSYHA